MEAAKTREYGLGASYDNTLTYVVDDVNRVIGVDRDTGSGAADLIDCTYTGGLLTKRRLTTGHGCPAYIDMDMTYDQFGRNDAIASSLFGVGRPVVKGPLGPRGARPQGPSASHPIDRRPARYRSFGRATADRVPKPQADAGGFFLLKAADGSFARTVTSEPRRTETTIRRPITATPTGNSEAAFSLSPLRRVARITRPTELCLHSHTQDIDSVR